MYRRTDTQQRTAEELIGWPTSGIYGVTVNGYFVTTGELLRGCFGNVCRPSSTAYKTVVVGRFSECSKHYCFVSYYQVKAYCESQTRFKGYTIDQLFPDHVFPNSTAEDKRKSEGGEGEKREKGGGEIRGRRGEWQVGGEGEEEEKEEEEEEGEEMRGWDGGERIWGLSKEVWRVEDRVRREEREG